jgi:hypothetical protein
VSISATSVRPKRDELLGDPEKARRKLGWKHKVGFAALVREMVREDVRLARLTASASGSPRAQPPQLQARRIARPSPGGAPAGGGLRRAGPAGTFPRRTVGGGAQEFSRGSRRLLRC